MRLRLAGRHRRRLAMETTFGAPCVFHLNAGGAASEAASISNRIVADWRVAYRYAAWGPDALVAVVFVGLVALVGLADFPGTLKMATFPFLTVDASVTTPIAANFFRTSRTLRANSTMSLAWEPDAE